MARWQANLLILMVALIWGTAFVAQQTGVKNIPPLFFTGTRFLLGGLAVVPLMLMERRKLGFMPNGKELLWVCGTGVCLYLGAHLQQLGIGLTTVTNAGFFTSLYVLLVPVFGFVMWRVRPHWSVWPAVFGCMAGAWALSGGEIASLNDGDYLVMISAIFWALQVLLVGHVVIRTNAPYTLACMQFLTCAVIGIGSGLVMDYDAFSWDGFQAGGIEILYAGVLSVGVAFTLQAVAQSYTQPADAAIIMSSEAVFAAVGGALMLAERVNAMEMAGCAIILISIIAVQVLPLLRRAPQAVE